MPLQPTARSARPPRPSGQARPPAPAGSANHARGLASTAAHHPADPVHPKPADPRSSKPRLKGQKQALPHKPCQTCGRPMSWRKRWARCWDEVRHCSDACRRGTPRHG